MSIVEEWQVMRVRVDGVELHYIEAGAGEPIVLLHGGMGDYRSWRAFMGSFGASHRAISYSRRYHFPNRNAWNAVDHSACAEADDLEALLREIGVAHAHLVGTSYGALTALAFAITRPQVVCSLVLVEPPLHPWIRSSARGAAVHDAFVSAIWAPARATFEQGDVRGALRILIDGFELQPRFDRLPETGIAQIMENAQAMAALLSSVDPFPNLPQRDVRALRMPRLIIRGECTSEIHRLVCDELNTVMADARYLVLGGTGHACVQQDPSAFETAALDFIRSTARISVT